jgi:hypothetical protein
LPDGLFSNQKYQLGNFWGVFWCKMLVSFMAIWSILWQSGNILRLFGIFYGNLVHFPRFGKF